MKNIVKFFLILSMSFILFGCDNKKFYETYDIMEKQELEILETNEKTNNISTIVENITIINEEEYTCSKFEEISFIKSYVPITQRNYVISNYNNDKFRELCTTQSFSPDYNYFEEYFANIYIDCVDEKTIYYLENKSIFENNIVENNDKNIFNEKINLSSMFPLYYLFIQEQYAKNNSNIIQMNDCYINDFEYYHLQFSSSDYDDILLGDKNISYTLNNSIYDYYIKKDTLVVEYIVFSKSNDVNNKYYCLINYKKGNEDIVIPNYLINLK